MAHSARGACENHIAYMEKQKRQRNSSKRALERMLATVTVQGYHVDSDEARKLLAMANEEYAQFSKLQNEIVAETEGDWKLDALDDLKSALHDTADSSPPAQLELRAIPTPRFDGAILNWLMFKDAFENLIHNQPLPEIVKLVKLREAIDPNMVHFVGDPTRGYTATWEAIKQRYDDPCRLAYAYVTRILDLDVVTRESRTGLLHVVDNVRAASRGLQVIQAVTFDAIMVPLMRRLPSAIQQAWLMQLPDKSVPPLESLLFFVENRGCNLPYLEESATVSSPAAAAAPSKPIILAKPSTTVSISVLGGIPIRRFDGALLNWLVFKDAFENLIHNQPVPEIVKLVTLREAIDPEKVPFVRDYTSGYTATWEALKQRYDDPYRLANAYVTSILDLHVVTEESRAGFLHVVHNVRAAIRGLQVIQAVTFDAIMVPLVMRRLPSVTLQAWIMQLPDHSVPPLESLLSFAEHRGCSLPYLPRPEAPLPRRQRPSRHRRGHKHRARAALRDGRFTSRPAFQVPRRL